MTEPADMVLPEPEPDDNTRLFAVPQDRPRARSLNPDPTMPSTVRPRRQNTRNPPPLPWQGAHWIDLRTAGTGTERVHIDAVAIARDWVTVRHHDDHRDRVTAYPAWRVTEIELHPHVS